MTDRAEKLRDELKVLIRTRVRDAQLKEDEVQDLLEELEEDVYELAGGEKLSV